MGRKILICDFDIFKLTGGGQTVYQNIIRKCPHDTFYYFGDPSQAGSDRPDNAIVVPFRSFYAPDSADIPPTHRHFLFVYRDAINMARSLREAVGGATLDVVDTPDYRQNGLFIRYALETHGFTVGVVALALHGTLSSAFLQGWPWTDDPARSFAELRQREHLQFRVVDARYAISSFYVDKLQRYSPLPINMLDPLVVIRDTRLSLAEPENRAADLLFIGRRERRKGPDLFVDMAWWLPRGAYRKLILIGDDGLNHQGTGSQAIIEAMIHRRGLDVVFMPSMDQSALQELARQKSLVFLPSRFDQFNLVALEALLEGCPTVISRSAGVAQFIEERLPELSWLLVDLTCDRAAIQPVAKILRDYDRKRQSIVDAVRRARLYPDIESLGRMYKPTNQYDRRASGFLHDLADRFGMDSVAAPQGDLNRLLKFAASSSAGRLAPIGRRGLGSATRSVARVGRVLRSLLRAPRATIATIARRLVNRGYIRRYAFGGMAVQLSHLQYAAQIRRNQINFPERSTSERANKLKYMADVVLARRLDRVRYFRDIIRLERLRGNDLIAATYGLRIIRWLGTDTFRLLGFIQDTLREHGFVREAEVAQVMYGDPARAHEACRDLLDSQLKQHRANVDRPWEIIEDRRDQRAPRVSIIVSMYNAATKLPTFWRMLQQQSLLRSGQAEVILVDSGSPSNEHAVFKQLCARDPLPVVYARSKNRETIQAAWNRGIKLSAAPYLAFLGVDEGLHPECLAILADELDRSPATDWVMSDSIVTEVDRANVYDRDIMAYDRRGYRHDWNYLDCTFLSYVGGLYRRNIHDKLGYYDESFRAAGDTEFKNRVLPHIKSKHVPRPLGVFNNYPEERTTQHPRAEIEDLRAWYLHRTPAGVAYAFDNRPVKDVVDLLKDTMAYRKCYCQHTSTDFDLADSLANYLETRPDASQYRGLADVVRAILQSFQKFELLQPTRGPWFPEPAVIRNYRNIQRLNRDLAGALGMKTPRAIDVFRDNRYEQHWWPWNT